MGFCRFGDVRFGLVEGFNVRDVTAAASHSPSLPLANLKLLSPVANRARSSARAGKLQEALEESSLAGLDEGIALRKLDRRNDHEVELAFATGKQCSMSRVLRR
jgi:hypothetical protein